MTGMARTDRGFSITELMLTVAVAATVMGLAVPVLSDLSDSVKLNEAARVVERELQDARMKAVSSNRAVRVRMNCPAAQYIRRVEVLGTSADTATNRCLPTAYPYPPDDDLMTRPNYDGPVRVLPNNASVSTATIEFRPDGTAYTVSSGVPTVMSSPVTITVTRKTSYRMVTVNGVGKIQLQ